MFPNDDDIDKILNQLDIYIFTSVTSFNSYYSVVKALSKNGKPIFAKFFVDKDMADHETNIGQVLKEKEIAG